MLLVDVERTLAEEVEPILHGRRRNSAVRPVGPFDGGERLTLVVDAGVAGDDAVPLDNEKYEGLSVNMRTQAHRVCTLSRLSLCEDAFCHRSRSLPTCSSHATSDYSTIVLRETRPRILRLGILADLENSNRINSTIRRT